jgi:hypothetical protein
MPHKFPRVTIRFRKRFQRPAPICFVILAVLSFIGGLLYIPSNGDSITYRIPRVMHWLAAGQWNWIHTLDERMNIAGCGMEWFFAPLILLTRSDRLLFLPNIISFLLLPGLIFSVFTRLRISPRAAWWWMWLLPSGWCFVMQAGSTINDSFAAVYTLAAIDFALRARERESISDVWFALLSAALATGVKQTTIPLALPGLIALWPCRHLIFKRPLSSTGVAVVCLLVSALPTIIINLHSTGNWAGITPRWEKTALNSPLWGIIGNVFCLTAQNLKPPIFPFVESWNAAMHHFLQTPFGAHFQQFEDFGKLSLGAGESSSGIGLGIILLLILSILTAWHFQRTLKPARADKDPNFLPKVLRWLPWVLLVIFMAKVGSRENARQLASYYILFFPSLLLSSGHSIVVRRWWWKAAALSVMALAIVLMIISRDRPLFPSQTLINNFLAKHPNSKFVGRIGHSYSDMWSCENEDRVLGQNMPPDAKILGYATAEGGAEPSLWLPFGRRTVERVLPDDSADEIRAKGMHYVVVEDTLIGIDAWLLKYNGTIIQQWNFGVDSPRILYLVQLQ